MDWSFNKSVAETFGQHARAHIPDYDIVISESVNLCNQYLESNSPILEIGCAIGETVKLLSKSGFTNIHAVDNSQSMLDQCPSGLATYYCSSAVPDVDFKFDAVLCNWTLHFIKQKVEYLTDIYNSMNDGGFLILSEKTCNNGYPLEQYHNFKRRMGVTQEEITTKAESLKNIMFINSIGWYINTLTEIGFKHVYISRASWCFTTFTVIK